MREEVPDKEHGRGVEASSGAEAQPATEANDGLGGAASGPAIENEVDVDGRPSTRFVVVDPVFTRQMSQISQQIVASLQPRIEGLYKQAALSITATVAPIQQSLQVIVEEAIAGIQWPTFHYSLPPGLFDNLVDLWDRTIPPNWSKTEQVGPTVDVVREDGLPLMWLPRADIVTAVVQAADRPSRVGILLARQIDVLDDCDEVLDAITAPTRPGDLVLARQAVQALREGHGGAAQALAAAVLESTIAVQVTDTSTVRRNVTFDEHSEFLELRLRVALAPLEPYFRSFTPGKTPESQRPPGPNRHLTVHLATPEHLSMANALISVMLLVSVLRALQDLPALRSSGVDLSWLTR